MLLSLTLFTITAIFLFLSSQALLTHLLRRLPLYFVFFLLLPGIFLHEFSHVLMAEILGVHTGELKLKPELKDGHLTLGSAQIALTDPFRLTLIGIAPFLNGLLGLWLLIYFNPGGWWQILFAWLAFSLANTLFSSPSDLQSAAVPILLVLIIFGLAKLLNLSLPPNWLPYLTNFFMSLAKVFGLALALNLILLLPFKLFRKS